MQIDVVSPSRTPLRVSLKMQIDVVSPSQALFFVDIGLYPVDENRVYLVYRSDHSPVLYFQLATDREIIRHVPVPSDLHLSVPVIEKTCNKQVR